MITPNDIETKVFSFSVRGYNRREVDEFLDQIMIDYQALLDQNAKMLERVHVLQKQVTEAKDPANMTRDAKHLMNDISASAEQKAEVIIKNAQREAESIVKNAKNNTSQADEDAERLRQKVEKFKLRFKQLLEDEIERVDDTSEDLLDDLRKDFYPAFLYNADEAQDFTKIAGTTDDEDLIKDLPDAYPEETSEEAPSETEEQEGQGTEEPEIEVYSAGAEEEEEPEAEEESEEAFEEAEELPQEEKALEEAEAEEEAEAPAFEEAAPEEPEEEPAEEPHEETPEEEYADYAASEPVEEKEEPEAEAPLETETSWEIEEPEEKEEEIDDPLLARAKDENVDVDDLPGFRSSASSMDDTIVIKKLQKDNTMALDADEVAEKSESLGEQTAEKAKELKDSAAKFMNDLFSKKDK